MAATLHHQNDASRPRSRRQSSVQAIGGSSRGGGVAHRSSLSGDLDATDPTIWTTLPVTQIAEIERKTREKVNHKSEELRRAVGESYRDLIVSADSIIEMNEFVSNTLRTISSLKSALDGLPSLKLAETGMSEEKAKARNRRRCNELVAEITASPEKVWSHLDKRCFSDAARDFFRVHAVYEDLLDSSHELHQHFVNMRFEQTTWEHWLCVEQLPFQILEASFDCVSRAEASPEDIADALCAIAVLHHYDVRSRSSPPQDDGELKSSDEHSPPSVPPPCSLAEVLTLFLESKRSWVEHVMGSFSNALDTTDEEDLSSVFSHGLASIASAIRLALLQVSALFTSPTSSESTSSRSSSLLRDRLNSLSSSLARSRSRSALPAFEWESDIPTSDVQSVCSQWLGTMQSMLDEKLYSFLQRLTRGDRMATVRDSVVKSVCGLPLSASVPSLSLSPPAVATDDGSKPPRDDSRRESGPSSPGYTSHKPSALRLRHARDESKVQSSHASPRQGPRTPSTSRAASGRSKLTDVIVVLPSWWESTCGHASWQRACASVLPGDAPPASNGYHNAHMNGTGHSQRNGDVGPAKNFDLWEACFHPGFSRRFRDIVSLAFKSFSDDLRKLIFSAAESRRGSLADGEEKSRDSHSTSSGVASSNRAAGVTPRPMSTRHRESVFGFTKDVTEFSTDFSALLTRSLSNAEALVKCSLSYSVSLDRSSNSRGSASTPHATSISTPVPVYTPRSAARALSVKKDVSIPPSLANFLDSELRHFSQDECVRAFDRFAEAVNERVESLERDVHTWASTLSTSSAAAAHDQLSLSNGDASPSDRRPSHTSSSAASRSDANQSSLAASSLAVDQAVFLARSCSQFAEYASVDSLRAFLTQSRHSHVIEALKRCADRGFTLWSFFIGSSLGATFRTALERWLSLVTQEGGDAMLKASRKEVEDLHIPTHASPHVVEFLFSFTKQIQKIIHNDRDGDTRDHEKIIMLTISSIVQTMVTIHSQVVTDSVLSSLSEAGRLQLTLDLMFMFDVLKLPPLRATAGSRRSAAPADLSRTTRALVSRVTSSIDPVNWMCLKKHMDTEVRTLFRRYGVVFGDLMRLRPATPDAQSQAPTPRAEKPSQQHQHAFILALAKPISRVQTLPVDAYPMSSASARRRQETPLAKESNRADDEAKKGPDATRSSSSAKSSSSSSLLRGAAAARPKRVSGGKAKRSAAITSLADLDYTPMVDEFGINSPRDRPTDGAVPGTSNGSNVPGTDAGARLNSIASSFLENVENVTGGWGGWGGFFNREQKSNPPSSSR